MSVDSPIATENLAGRTGNIGEAREEEVNEGHLLGQRPGDERSADVAEKRHDLRFMSEELQSGDDLEELR